MAHCISQFGIRMLPTAACLAIAWGGDGGDVQGNPVAGQTFTWATANASIATVSETGLVTGVDAGQTEITALSDTTRGGLMITVTADTALPPPPPGSGVPGLQEIVSGLDIPVFLTSPPNDD